MVTHTYDQIQFEGPDGWLDASIITLVAPAGAKFRSNIVVSRDEADGDETATEYGRVQLKDLKKQLKKFQLHQELETVIGERNALVLEFGFKSPEGADLRQRSAFVRAGTLIYTMSVTAAEANFEAERVAFERALGSLRLKAGG